MSDYDGCDGDNEVSKDGYHFGAEKSLPPSFALHFDIETEKQLQHEVEYLVNRLAHLMTMCNDNGMSIDAYVKANLTFKKE